MKSDTVNLEQRKIALVNLKDKANDIFKGLDFGYSKEEINKLLAGTEVSDVVKLRNRRLLDDESNNLEDVIFKLLDTYNEREYVVDIIDYIVRYHASKVDFMKYFLHNIEN